MDTIKSNDTSNELLASSRKTNTNKLIVVLIVLLGSLIFSFGGYYAGKGTSSSVEKSVALETPSPSDKAPQPRTPENSNQYRVAT